MELTSLANLVTGTLFFIDCSAFTCYCPPVNPQDRAESEGRTSSNSNMSEGIQRIHCTVPNDSMKKEDEKKEEKSWWQGNPQPRPEAADIVVTDILLARATTLGLKQTVVLRTPHQEYFQIIVNSNAEIPEAKVQLQQWRLACTCM